MILPFQVDLYLLHREPRRLELPFDVGGGPVEVVRGVRVGAKDRNFYRFREG